MWRLYVPKATTNTSKSELTCAKLSEPSGLFFQLGEPFVLIFRFGRRMFFNKG